MNQWAHLIMRALKDSRQRGEEDPTGHGVALWKQAECRPVKIGQKGAEVTSCGPPSSRLHWRGRLGLTQGRYLIKFYWIVLGK